MVADNCKNTAISSYFEEMKAILINDIISYNQIFLAIAISIFYFMIGVAVFYISYAGAKVRGL